MGKCRGRRRFISRGGGGSACLCNILMLRFYLTADGYIAVLARALE